MSFIVIVVLLFSSMLFSDEVNLQAAQPLFKLCGSGSDYYELEFNLSSFQTEDIVANGKNYTKISHPEAGYLQSKGMAELPVFGTMLAIPPQAEVSYQIISEQKQVFNNYKVYPVQDEKSTAFILKDNYKSNTTYPGESIKLDASQTIRNYHVLNIKIQPFSYNGFKQELSISKQIKIRVTYTNPTQLSSFNLQPKLSRSFERVYEKLFLNYAEIRDASPVYQKPCILMIYRENAATMGSINRLVQWKKEKGYEVHTATTQAIGPSASAIKSYIMNAYTQWENPPEYVVLIGTKYPSSGVESFLYPNPEDGEFNTDYSYSLMDNDNLPDVFLGRLAFGDLNQLSIIVDKIFLSEKELNLNNMSFYDNYLLAGDLRAAMSVVDVNRSVKRVIENHNPEAVIHEFIFDTDDVSNQISNVIDQGCLYLSYRGNGGTMGGFASEISTLVNYNKLNYGILMTVLSSTLNYGTCESYLTAHNTGGPTGGFSAIGMTNTTHTSYANFLSQALMSGMMQKDLANWGEAVLYAKACFFAAYDGADDHAAFLESLYGCHLIGDPSMDVITMAPDSMHISYPAQINQGEGLVLFTVRDQNNQPLRDAWVSLLSDSTVCTSGLTDASGIFRAVLPTDYHGWVKMAVTKQDFIPIIDSLEISAAGALIYQAVSIDDDQSNGTSGNNNHELNPGEEIDLRISLRNTLPVMAEEITLTVEVNNPYIHLNNNILQFPQAGAGAIVESENPIRLIILQGCPDNQEILLNLHITTDQGSWDKVCRLVVKGLDIEVMGVLTGGTVGHYLASGEPGSLIVSIKNMGTLPINDVYGILSCTDSRVSIQDSIAFFNDLQPDEQLNNVNDPYVLSLSTMVLPGEELEFVLRFVNLDGYSEQETFSIPVDGSQADVPTGPDSYGYICYNNNDNSSYTDNLYNWYELVGTGATVLNLSDPGNNTDQTVVVDLPFTFTFYGVDYAQISICSNGWISPGVTNQTTFRNYPLPSPAMPIPLIAPFWTDLWVAGGHVLTYYDQNQHAFIVQWEDVNYSGPSEDVTFEAILYDSAYNPTSTGDSRIKFQYEDLQMVTNYSNYYHRVAPTIGIQNADFSSGLQYCYDLEYDGSAQPISSGSALSLTTIDKTDGLNNLFVDQVIVDNSVTENCLYPGSTVDLSVSFHNLGMTPMGFLNATLINTSTDITVVNGTTIYQDLNPNTNVFGNTPFTIHVSPDAVTSMQTFTIHLQSGTDSYDFNFSLQVKRPEIYLHSIIMREIEGDDDLCLDPGELIHLGISVRNAIDFWAEDIQLDVSTENQDIAFLAPHMDYGKMAFGMIQQQVFPLTISNTVPVPSVIPVIAVVTSHGAIIDTLNFNLNVGDPFASFSDNFDVLNEEYWSFISGPLMGVWNLFDSNYAGGQTPELKFTGGVNNLINRAMTIPLYFNNYSPIIIEFNHSAMVPVGTPNYTLALERKTVNGGWVSLWNYNSATSYQNMHTEVIVPDTQPYNSVQFAWKVVTSAPDLVIYLDNIRINSQTQPSAKLNGLLSFSSVQGDLNKALILVDGSSTQPDEIGNFEMILPPADYQSLRTIFPGFYADRYDNLTLQPGSDQIYNFTMNHFNTPQALSLVNNDYTVNLSWQAPVQQAQTRQQSHKKVSGSNLRPDLVQYKIYRKTNSSEFEYIAETTGLNYTTTLYNTGAYKFKVTAEYEEGESDFSNEVMLNLSNSAPIVNSQSPVEDSVACSAGDNLTFSVDVIEPDSTEVQYEWFVNDIPMNNNNEIFNYTFTESGIYSVKVAISDEIITQIREWTVYAALGTGDVTELYQNKLYQNSPNPFNPSTTIRFELKEPGKVKLDIYNIKGQLVKNLQNEVKGRGLHSVVWNGKDSKGRNVSSGLYFYRIQAKGFSKINKCLLLK